MYTCSIVLVSGTNYHIDHSLLVTCFIAYGCYSM